MDFAFLDEDESISSIAPAYQPKIYVIMRISPRLGGTYSEIRKSYAGVKRLLKEWDFMGISMENVRVFPMEKAWIPVKKGKEKRIKINKISKEV